MTVLYNEVWTKQRVDRLTEMWAAGNSSSQIAAELKCFDHCNDRGRSAVIGKIHRMKLPQPDGKMSRAHRPYRMRGTVDVPTPSSNPSRIAAQSRSFGDTFSGQKKRRNPSHNILAKIAIEADEPGLPEKLKGEAPDGTGIKLLELRPNTCRWPRGDPQEADFEFCGGRALPSLPYCSHHSRIAYTPATERRRLQPRV